MTKFPRFLGVMKRGPFFGVQRWWHSVYPTGQHQPGLSLPGWGVPGGRKCRTRWKTTAELLCGSSQGSRRAESLAARVQEAAARLPAIQSLLGASSAGRRHPEDARTGVECRRGHRQFLARNAEAEVGFSPRRWLSPPGQHAPYRQPRGGPQQGSLNALLPPTSHQRYRPCQKLAWLTGP
jgi:hypothetical protein